MIAVVRINGVRLSLQLQDWVEDLMVGKAGHACFYAPPPGRLALVLDDEPGYRTIPLSSALAEDEMRQIAEALNEIFQITPDEAAKIVATSIRLSNTPAGRKIDLALVVPMGSA